MQKGLLNIPLLPVRSEPNERSEMTTQLLFGESFDVLEVQGSWSKIRNHADGYQGWATSKMLTELTDEMQAFLQRFPTVQTAQPLLCFKWVGAAKAGMYLPAGSRLHPSDDAASTFFVPTPTPSGYDLFEIKSSGLKTLNGEVSIEMNRENLYQLALQFLHAPYLWGGKSILGMDCSGLIQLCCSILGFSMPRDASQQAKEGEALSLDDARTGDLVFFANDLGRITHVGIVSKPGFVLHASGNVRIDSLTQEGIYNAELDLLTHKLHSVRRIFSN